MSTITTPEVEILREKTILLQDNLNQVIKGKEHTLTLLITALGAGGNVLMEDVPGVGKTTLAKALAASIEGKFSRVQFTPDLLPSDILGNSIYNQQEAEFFSVRDRFLPTSYWRTKSTARHLEPNRHYSNV